MKVKALVGSGDKIGLFTLPFLLVVDGQTAIQDYLSLTISFDHEIIDVAPAARFTQRLKELIESAYGLAGHRCLCSEHCPGPGMRGLG